jgi:hypothetical protein
MLSTTLTSQEIDDVLAGSFPASDPPAWTPGIARPAPANTVRVTVKGTEGEDVHAGDVIDLSTRRGMLEVGQPSVAMTR